MSVSIQTVEFERREAHLSELEDGPPYTVHGIALGSGDVTVGQSGIKKLWPNDELKKAAETLEGTNLVEDHKNSARGVVGKVTKSGFKDGVGVIYEAELFDEDLAEKIDKGLLEVSIRGGHIDVDEMEEDDETGALIVEGIRFQNLSVVPTGASPSNTLAMGEQDELSVAELSEYVGKLNGYESDNKHQIVDGLTLVSDQESDGESLTIDKVRYTEGDFVARLYRFHPEKGDYSDRLGHVQLNSGEHTNVEVELYEPLQTGAHVIQVHLHKQAHEPEGGDAIGEHSTEKNPTVSLFHAAVNMSLEELDASSYSWRAPDYDGTTEGEWSRPTLSDFEDAGIEDLQEIGSHFIAVQGDWPAENFGELKLPVVAPNGDLSVSALQAVRGGRGVTAMKPSPSDEMVDDIFAMTSRLAKSEFDLDWPSSREEAQQNPITVGAVHDVPSYTTASYSEENGLHYYEVEQLEEEFDAGDTVQWDGNHGIIFDAPEDSDEAEVDIYEEDDDGVWRSTGEEVTVSLDDLEEWDIDFDDIGPMDSDEEEAASTGDKVSWSSSGGSARGIVRDRKTDGCFNEKIDGDVEVCADDDDAVLLIEVVDETEDGFEASGTMVAHKESSVNSANFELNKFRPKDGQMVQWQANPSMFGRVVHVDTDKQIAMVQIMEQMDGQMVSSGFTVTAGYEDVVPMDSDKEEMSETFDDYPEAASNNAQMALDARDDTDNPNDCGTDVGWTRANQLASGEPLSEEIVSRMAQFNRHRENKEQGDEGKENCGWMMWKAWGGDEGVDWAISKLEQIEEENMYENNSYNESKSSTVSLFKQYSNETSGLATMAGFREWLEEDGDSEEPDVPDQFQFDSEEDAEEVADEMGIEGAHQMGDVWVPGDTHEMFVEAMEDMDEEERASYDSDDEEDEEDVEDDESEKGGHDDDEEDEDEEEDDDEMEGEEIILEECLKMMNQFVTGDGDADATVGEFEEWADGDENVDRAVEMFVDSDEDASRESGLREMDSWAKGLLDSDEGDDDEEETEPSEEMVTAIDMIESFLDTDDADEQSSVDEFVEWADDPDVDEVVMMFTEEDDMSPNSEVRELWNWVQDQTAEDEEEAKMWGEGEEMPITNIARKKQNLEQSPERGLTEEMASGSSNRRTSANEESVGSVSVLTGDDLRNGSLGESETDSLTTQVITNMTTIEEELSELDEPVAVEKNDLEELQSKANQFEDMNSSLEELRERTDILDSVDREQVEELAESEEPVVVESTRYEELTAEAEQVKGVYAEALSEAYDLFEADELCERYSIEELRSKYEDNIGDPEEELAASPRSGDPSEEELEEAAEEGGTEELSDDVASKQEELRNKIIGGR